MKGMEALDPEESAFSKLIASMFKKDSHETPRALQRNTRKVANLIIPKSIQLFICSFNQLCSQKASDKVQFKAKVEKKGTESMWISTPGIPYLCGFFNSYIHNLHVTCS